MSLQDDEDMDVAVEESSEKVLFVHHNVVYVVMIFVSRPHRSKV